MNARFFSALAVTAVLAACGGGDADGGAATSQDTSLVPSVDTVAQPVEVPTQDTVVTTTTQDTIQGSVDSAVVTDSAAVTTTP